MTHKTLKYGLLLCSLLLPLAYADPAFTPKQKTLTIGIAQYPSTLHPIIENMVAKSYVLGMVQRSLTAYDADWNLVCMLCQTLPTLENGLAKLEETPKGEEGIAVTYTLQQNAKWGDGTPVTTKDVTFTWAVGRNPQVGTNNLEMYRRIYKIDVVDDKTFTLHIDKRTFDYNAMGDFNVLPEHIERPVFEASAKEYKNRTRYDADSTNPGLYFGPYRVVEAVRGSYIALERNPTWYGKSPYFDRIVVRTVENTSALEANLLSGNIDMVAGELGLHLDQALAFEKRQGGKFNILYQPGLFYEHIELNLQNPILADKRVRQALLYAMDRELISQQLFQGKQPVAHTSVSPLDKVATDRVRKYAYNPAKAKKLLDAAGWTVMRKGIRHNAKGEALRLEINSTAGDKTRELVEQVLQSQWKQVGIDLRIRNEAPRVFFGETTRERKFSAMAMFAWVSSPENVPRSTLHSGEIPTQENNFSGQNYTTFRHAEMDRLIDAIEKELDPEKRLPYWHRIQQIYAEELPVLPLYFRANAFILPQWLKGLKPTGHLDQSTLWVENWSRAE